MIDILDRTYKPSLDELSQFINGKAYKGWQNLHQFLFDNFNPKIEIMYSVCKAKPGWNIKYKKSSKALCTLYPEKDSFIILIVYNSINMEWFKGIREKCTKYVIDKYDESANMNGTKWIMIDVTDDNILDDIKRMIKLKLEG